MYIVDKKKYRKAQHYPDLTPGLFGDQHVGVCAWINDSPLSHCVRAPPTFLFEVWLPMSSFIMSALWRNVIGLKTNSWKSATADAAAAAVSKADWIARLVQLCSHGVENGHCHDELSWTIQRTFCLAKVRILSLWLASVVTINGSMFSSTTMETERCSHRFWELNVWPTHVIINRFLRKAIITPSIARLLTLVRP